ncbi:retrovirus-related pol polyprotein from transposon TNT 1-94 [Tanacetum coccineum]
MNLEFRNFQLTIWKKGPRGYYLLEPTNLILIEKKKIEKYIRGFPEGVKGNVTSSKPQNRRPKAVKVYVAAPAEGRGYAGNLPWCNRCKAHHQLGPCPPRCGKCHKLGHKEEDCRTRIPVAGGNSLQNVTCFGCGEKGHYKDKCPKERNPHNKWCMP